MPAEAVLPPATVFNGSQGFLKMRYFGWGLLFFVVAYLLPIAGRPLLRPDEFRYAEIPREMIESGDYVTPRLLRARYFEKPVLGYWMVAGSFRLFGENRFALRLPMAAATGLTALLLGLWIRRSSRDREWALWAALFYLSSGLVFVLGTTAVLDAVLCLFTTATMLCVHQAVVTEKWNFERLIWLVLCGVTAGLGFLTKGLVAWAVPGVAAAAWLLWTKRFKAFLWLPWIPLVALAATIAPWALEIHRAEPDFWNYFIVVEHLQRFRGGEESQHPEPFWFFIPILAGTLFPALLTVLPGAAAGKESWRRIWNDPVWRFAFCAWLLPFVFFSVSSGKLATYILPCYPFLGAVLTLPALEALRGRRRTALTIQLRVFDVLGWVLLAAGSGAVAFGAALWPPAALVRWLPALSGGSWFFILSGVSGIAGGIYILRRRNAPLRRVAGFLGALALAGACSGLVPELDSDKMPEVDLRALAASGGFDPARAHIFTYGQMGHAVAWVFRRSDTRLLFSAGEMNYGADRARAEKRPLLWSLPEFVQLLKRSDRPDVVYVVTWDGKNDRRFRMFAKYPHRKLPSRTVMVLVFPPAPAGPPAR